MYFSQFGGAGDPSNTSSKTGNHDTPGTQFSPPRLYGYTQWAVQKFTKQAGQEDTIKIDIEEVNKSRELPFMTKASFFAKTMSKPL